MLGGYPYSRDWDVSFETIEVLVGKVVGAAIEAMRMADGTTEITRESLEVPSKGAKFAGEVAEVAEIGYGMIVTIDQTASGVHGALSEASDGQYENAKGIFTSPIRKGKAAKKFHSKMMKVRRLFPSGIGVLSMKTYSILLEELCLLNTRRSFMRLSRIVLSDSSMHWW